MIPHGEAGLKRREHDHILLLLELFVEFILCELEGVDSYACLRFCVLSCGFCVCPSGKDLKDINVRVFCVVFIRCGAEDHREEGLAVEALEVLPYR